MYGSQRLMTGRVPNSRLPASRSCGVCAQRIGGEQCKGGLESIGMGLGDGSMSQYLAGERCVCVVVVVVVGGGGPRGRRMVKKR